MHVYIYIRVLGRTISRRAARVRGKRGVALGVRTDARSQQLMYELDRGSIDDRNIDHAADRLVHIYIYVFDSIDCLRRWKRAPRARDRRARVASDREHRVHVRSIDRRARIIRRRRVRTRTTHL
jgi:hypothetical protein